MMTSALTSLRKMLLIPDRDPLDYPFVESDVAMLQRVLADPARHAVDDPTWKDLMLSDYCADLSQEVSIFGQHVLYRRLREGGCDTLAPAVAALVDDPGQAAALQEADLAVARHLARTPVYCAAVRSEARAIALHDTVHPLLPVAQPLTLSLDGRGAFISGQNGIGKPRARIRACI